MAFVIIDTALLVGFFRLCRKLPSIDWLCRVDHVELPRHTRSVTKLSWRGQSIEALSAKLKIKKARLFIANKSKKKSKNIN